MLSKSFCFISAPILLKNTLKPKATITNPIPTKNDNALFAIFLAPLNSKKYARFSKWIHTLIIKQGNILKNTPSETNIEILERKNILESFGLADTKTLPIIINKKSNTNPKCKKTLTKCFCIRFTNAVKNNKSKAKYKNTTRYCAKNSSTITPFISGKNDDLANATHGIKTNNTQILIIIHTLRYTNSCIVPLQ